MAGLDLNRKIIEETRVKRDQDHFSVLLHSFPSEIADRTEYLSGRIKTNPAFALCRVLAGLALCGATVAGIPCNTAHSPAIFEPLLKQIRKKRMKIRLLNMIEETGRFIHQEHPKLKRAGLLCTLGTYASGVYPKWFSKFDLAVILPPVQIRKAIHAAIYDNTYGIKAKPSPVTVRARQVFIRAVAELKKCGADGIILGCTEIPLALTEKKLFGLPLIDPTRILARSLIREIR